jgi:hypothetical protein
MISVMGRHVRSIRKLGFLWVVQFSPRIGSSILTSLKELLNDRKLRRIILTRSSKPCKPLTLKHGPVTNDSSSNMIPWPAKLKVRQLLKSASAPQRRGKNSASDLVTKLNQGDAEFLLSLAKDGRLLFRVGQIWKIPERKGETALLLDYDHTRKIDRSAIRKRLAQCGLVSKRILSRTSPGGDGIHAVVWVAGRLRKMDVVALQAILESDPQREAQNFRRAKQEKGWDKNWNVLFESKGKTSYRQNQGSRQATKTETEKCVGCGYTIAKGAELCGECLCEDDSE